MERKKLGKCAVCRHREATPINMALSAGVAIRALSKRYGVSIDSLYRHSKRHLPPQLRAKFIAGPALDGLDFEKLIETEGQSLLANCVALRSRLYSALDVAEESEDAGMIARISSQLHSNFELVGKLVGDLATGSVTNNILIAPEFLQLRSELTAALRPFPDARRAVASVLHKLESQAAQVIEAKPRELAR